MTIEQVIDLTHMSESANTLQLSLKRRFPIISKMSYAHPYSSFRGIIGSKLKRASSVVDVGCGQGALGLIIGRYNERAKYSVGVDAYVPYLRYCQKKRLYDEFVACDIRFLPFINCAFDDVVSIEVIEHLPKTEGLLFLEELERIGSKQVVISTPYGYMEMYHRNLEPLEDSLMKHRSGWLPEEFVRRGYTVRGQNGPRILPRDLAYWLSFFLPLTYFSPASSYGMICFKELAPQSRS